MAHFALPGFDLLIRQVLGTPSVASFRGPGTDDLRRPNQAHSAVATPVTASLIFVIQIRMLGPRDVVGPRLMIEEPVVQLEVRVGLLMNVRDTEQRVWRDIG